MRIVSEKVYFWLLTSFLVVGLGSGCYHFDPSAQWVESNGSFKIRAIKEKTFLGNHLYSFQTTRSGSYYWRTVFAEEWDEPVALSDKQVKIVTTDVGYIAFGRVVAVTITGGKSWIFFNIREHSDFGRNNPREAEIERVEMGVDGKGVIILDPYDLKPEECPTFTTTDFGQTWTEMGPTG